MHLFHAEDLILLFNCISQFLGKALLAGPQLILLCSTSLTFQLEDLTRNMLLRDRRDVSVYDAYNVDNILLHFYIQYKTIPLKWESYSDLINSESMQGKERRRR
jgi:hypothetical protein